MRYLQLVFVTTADCYSRCLYCFFFKAAIVSEWPEKIRFHMTVGEHGVIEFILILIWFQKHFDVVPRAHFIGSISTFCISKVFMMSFL